MLWVMFSAGWSDVLRVTDGAVASAENGRSEDPIGYILRLRSETARCSVRRVS